MYWNVALMIMTIICTVNSSFLMTERKYIWSFSVGGFACIYGSVLVVRLS